MERSVIIAPAVDDGGGGAQLGGDEMPAPAVRVACAICARAEVLLCKSCQRCLELGLPSLRVRSRTSPLEVRP